ncbi:hypothetical protein PsorP6_011016 [Peronosclerospora sorghi]|uniref:Uncharacterized protein n=1 Tax=Peronosclerospora sorghi TaxID=230839 RepID=A0ACC0VVM9_9STRA|nr:hypothetical protein PsorP6_011016 [Peronosclerospora sorghi]
MSSLSLHWMSNLESTFRQVLDTFKPDGAFVGTVRGGNSLQELRYAYVMTWCFKPFRGLRLLAFILADQERQGGLSSHISLFMNIADTGNLLASTCAQVRVTVYQVQTLIPRTWFCGHSGHGQSPGKVPQCFGANMEHLKGVGENNAITSRHELSRATRCSQRRPYLPFHVWSTGRDGACHISSHLLYWLVPSSKQVPTTWFSITLVKGGPW